MRLFPSDTNKTHLESSRNTNGNGWERQFALSSRHCSVPIFDKKILDFIRILEILELLTKVKSPQVVRNHNRHETSLVKIRENDRFPCDFRFLSSTNIQYDAKCKTMMEKKQKNNTQQTWCLSKYAAKSRPPEWSHCSLHWDTISCFLFIWRATSRMSTGVNLWVKEQEKKKSRQLLLLQEAGSCRHPSSLAYDLRPSSPPPTDQRDFHRARGNGDTHVSGGSESGRKWERVPMRVSCKHGEMDGGRGKRVKPAGSEDGQDKLTKTAEKEPIQASCEPLCQVKYQTRDS